MSRSTLQGGGHQHRLKSVPPGEEDQKDGENALQGAITDSRRNGGGSIDGGGVHCKSEWKLLQRDFLEVNYGRPNKNDCSAADQSGGCPFGDVGCAGAASAEPQRSSKKAYACRDQQQADIGTDHSDLWPRGWRDAAVFRVQGAGRGGVGDRWR